MKKFDLLNSLLDKILLTESYEDLEFIKADLFGTMGDVTDYSIALRDTITGVIYAIDCKINLNSRKYKVDRIDIQDKSYAKPRVINGNETTHEVVDEWIKHNIPLIIKNAIKFD